MKIGFDIDGVLAHFDRAFSAFANRVFGEKRIPDDYVPGDWNWSDVITRDEERMLWKELRKEEKFWTGLAPTEGAEQLNKWLRTYDGDFDLWYITARAPAGKRSISDQTKDWLYKHGLYYRTDGIIPVAKSPLKFPMLEGMGIEYFIDDHGETIVGAEKIPGLTACLLDRPWNQHVTVKNRVNSVKEFLNEFVGSGDFTEADGGNKSKGLAGDKEGLAV